MMPKQRLLYIGAGNPVFPAVGMDVVARAHLDEISQDSVFDLDGIFVIPGVMGKPQNPPAGEWGSIEGFAGDLAYKTPGPAEILKKILRILRFRIVAWDSFRSADARTKLRGLLAQAPDCIIIDHFAATVNIPFPSLMWAVLVRRCKLIYIAHNITANSLKDTARLKKSPLARMFCFYQAAQALVSELLICRLASRIIFISAYDRSAFGRWPGRHCAVLCPLLPARALMPDTNTKLPEEAYFVFVGPLAFPPNGFAIEWLARRLGPILYKIAPEAKILLAGKGTENLPWAAGPNVQGLGYVSDDRLQELLGASIGLVSPVIHGSGIKIKVLEAVAAGCPVFATEESLRGYEFLQLSPLIDIHDVEKTAEILAAFCLDKTRQAQYRACIADKWRRYAAVRANRLQRHVSGLCSAATISRRANDSARHSKRQGRFQ